MELKALHKENARLKKIVAEQTAGYGDSQGSREGKLVGLERRRQTVNELRRCLEPLKVSERRACRVLDQSRSTQRYQLRQVDDEPR